MSSSVYVIHLHYIHIGSQSYIMTGERQHQIIIYSFWDFFTGGRSGVEAPKAN